MTSSASDFESLSLQVPELEPLDEHNRALASNVHPADWVNPEPAGRYNLVVIGAGTAGLVSAAGAASLGARVALVERRLFGGDCLNVGCVPSKALLRSSRAIADVRDASALGIEVPFEAIRVDFPAIMRRMRRLRAGISPHDSVKRFADLGVDVFLGAGRFAGPDTVEVSGQRLLFSRAVIATGARAGAPPVPGLSEAGFLTNENLFSLTSLPRRLGIIGAGPIGCEMAQAFRRFGSEVHLFEAMHGILPREDAELSEIVRAALDRDGVRLHCCGKDLKVRREDGTTRLYATSHEGPLDVEVDNVLVSAGRVPNLDGLALEAAGVRYNAKGIEVDEYLRTSNPDVYAAGDICSAFQFTHAADAMARIVLKNALFFGRQKVSDLTIPWCTYTDPELAHVGLTEEQARSRGMATTVVRIPMDGVDRAILDGETEGLLKVVLREGSDRILGATLVARHAGDLLAELTLAMTQGIGLGKIASTVHPYPTQSEVAKRAGDAWNRTRLTPLVKQVLSTILAWRR
ncbi:MAG: mercuric reductase [Candidatus Wallbacteria bacterium]|nr:mercuric reductase [Candidatus Wallbacteria bacterium]